MRERDSRESAPAGLARHWRARAQELRKLAASIADADAKAGILAAARSYQRLALLHIQSPRIGKAGATTQPAETTTRARRAR